MSLTQIVRKEDINQELYEKKTYHSREDKKPMIYSQKLDMYIPLESGKPKGKIQEYNVGLGPGSWY